MSLRSVPRYAPAALAFAAWVLVAPAVSAAGTNTDPAETAGYFVSQSGVCHPMRGTCAKPQHAAEGPTAAAPGQDENVVRYSVSSVCHPAYRPSWNACKKGAGTPTIQIAELAK